MPLSFGFAIVYLSGASFHAIESEMAKSHRSSPFPQLRKCIAISLVYKKMETSIVSRAWAEAKFQGDQIICGRIPITRFGLFWRGRQHYGHWSFAVGDLPDGETARIGKDVINYLQEWSWND